jgi:GNAT superfamily N-acetyltransferase
MVSPHDTLNLPRQLEGGLILRLATPADTETLAEFNDQIHLEEDEPPGWLGIWTRDLMSGRHPTTSAADFVIVEDPSMNHKIVSATCLIPQVWRYKEIPFEVGRPELVGTDPAYRRRGLARIVFDQIHELSAAYGHMVQGITGIEWFYRQFGYEYALPLGGTRVLPIDGVPALDENEPEPFQVRPATEADVPTMMRLYDRHSATKLVTAVIGEAHWHWDLTGRSEGSMPGYRFFCVVDRDQQVLGYYVTPPLLWKQQMTIFELGTDEGISIPSILPTVLRALKKQGERYAAKLEKKGPTGIGLALGLEHRLRGRRGQAGSLPAAVRLVRPRARPARLYPAYRSGAGETPGPVAAVRLQRRSGYYLLSRGIETDLCWRQAERCHRLAGSGKQRALDRGRLPAAGFSETTVWLSLAGRAARCVSGLLGQRRAGAAAQSALPQTGFLGPAAGVDLNDMLKKESPPDPYG